jgi:LysM repeat protein
LGGVWLVSADRVRVWVARFAAPLAFFLAATVLVILVQRALESDSGEARSDGSTSQVDTGSTTPNPDGTANLPRGCRRARYTVRSGDTLESIAAKCDVSLSVLLELNPNIDPLALNPGDRVRIRARQQQREESA